MPCRDVPGRIHVSVASVPAGHAGEECLTLAILFGGVPACTTALTGVRGIDSLYSSRSLFFKATDQQPPAGCQDFTVQPRLLSHILAWPLDGSLDRPGHIPDLQVFNADQIELVGKECGCLLTPIFGDVSLPCSEPRSLHLHMGASVGAWSRACQLALKPAQPLSPSGRETPHTQQLTSRECCRNSHPPIDSYHIAHSWRRYRIRLRRERYVPAARSVERHPVRFHPSRHGARQAEPHPSDLGYPHLGHLTAKSSNIRRRYGDNSKPLMPPSLSPGRMIVGSTEVIGHCLGEVSDGLLLHYDASRPEPFKLGPCFGKLSALLHPARRASTTLSPPRPLFASEVPNEAGMRTMFQQPRLLGSAGLEAISGHERKLSVGPDKTEEVKWRGCPP
jgi:hypothetical protein